MRKAARAFLTKCFRTEDTPRFFIQKYVKYKSFEKEKASVQTIVLGSSHALHAYICDSNEFNLGEVSQDLYYSYNLYRKYADLPDLKKIILFYSVFSAGFELEHCAEAAAAVYYDVLYDIPFKNSRFNVFQRQTEIYRSYMKFANPRPNNHHGNIDKYPRKNNKTLDQKRVDGHLKHCFRHNGQIDFVQKILDLAREKKHQVCIVLSPARSDYKAALPPSDVLFKELYDLLKTSPDTKIYNAYDDPDFVFDDFMDTDHANKNGAVKTTAKAKSLFA